MSRIVPVVLTCGLVWTLTTAGWFAGNCYVGRFIHCDYGNTYLLESLQAWEPLLPDLIASFVVCTLSVLLVYIPARSLAAKYIRRRVFSVPAVVAAFLAPHVLMFRPVNQLAPLDDHVLWLLEALSPPVITLILLLFWLPPNNTLQRMGAR